MSSYLHVVEDVYAEAAEAVDRGLCCTTASSPVWQLPGLTIPRRMMEMNYGCGSTVDPRDLRSSDTVVYVGVGGGLEALQFAYLVRRPGGVIAVDPVAKMRDQARANFDEAARLNPWFRPEFVTIVDGNALDLPVENGSATVAAQNCLFNVFKELELRKVLQETIRVLKVGGRFYTSDPITPEPLPLALTQDDRLRARCISGCQTYERYLQFLTDSGFGRIEVRGRFPYRLLAPAEFPILDHAIMLESIEVAAYKEPEGPDGPQIFTGRTATYAGASESLDDGFGHVLMRGVPVAVSDRAAERLRRMSDVVVTEATFHARGSGCC